MRLHCRLFHLGRDMFLHGAAHQSWKAQGERHEEEEGAFNRRCQTGSVPTSCREGRAGRQHEGRKTSCDRLALLRRKKRQTDKGHFKDSQLHRLEVDDWASLEREAGLCLFGCALHSRFRISDAKETRWELLILNVPCDFAHQRFRQVRFLRRY